MVPSGPPTPIGGTQPVNPSLMRSNSGMLGAQGGALPSQDVFSSLVSPRTQFNNINVLGNVGNVSSLVSQSFANGPLNTGFSGLGSNQRGSIDTSMETDPLSNVSGNHFNNASNMVNHQIPGQQFSNASGNQLLPESQSQQLEGQGFTHGQQSMQQHFSAPLNTQQGQFQSIRGGLGPVKLESQVANGPQQQQSQQLQQSLRNLGPVKMEPQQLQPMRSLPPVKLEPQQPDPSLFLQQQQQQQQQQQHQQQQILHMSRQSSQAQINFLNQQRLLQLQQQQQQQQHQQQLLKAMPQQRPQLPQQFQQQNLQSRSPINLVYEPGMCARRLTRYMYQQQHRPEDNNIEFWRKFVAEYFAPNAKKKWCVSMYGSGRQTTGVFPQDIWHCEICNRKPGRGFEATVEVLPRLFKIKYESGTLEELLYIDMPHEYQNSSGQIVLDYAKAIQESVFDQLRVVRDGQLRIVFSADLKICSWEFCARRHEELIPRRLLIPQVGQLGAAAQKYQAATQNGSLNLSVQDLQNNCNVFVSSARQVAKALEVPLVNDLGYTKRFVRCLQISEVVNSMKDLIEYSRETGTGPMESLVKFPRRTSSATGAPNQTEQLEGQQQLQTLPQISNSDQSSIQATGIHVPASNGVSNTTNVPASTSAIVGLLHQNSMNSRQQISMNNANSPYGSNSMQITSPASSSTIPQGHVNPSPFQSPTPSLNNPKPANIASQQQEPAFSSEADNGDAQSSVQKILQEMIMSNQGSMVGVGPLGTGIKNMNGVFSSSNNGMVATGYSNMIGNSGLRGAMASNNSALNGRVGMVTMGRGQGMSNNNNHHQQSELGNQHLNGLGPVNGFSNPQFDWRPSP